MEIVHAHQSAQLCDWKILQSIIKNGPDAAQQEELEGMSPLVGFNYFNFVLREYFHLKSKLVKFQVLLSPFDISISTT